MDKGKFEVYQTNLRIVSATQILVVSVLQI